MSSFLKVDIRLVIDDGRNSNQKTYFNLRDIDDDLESLYQTRAKEWFPFSLTMKVPGLDPHQTVQVCFFFMNVHVRIHWPIKRGANTALDQLELEAKLCNPRKAHQVSLGLASSKFRLNLIETFTWNSFETHS